MDPTWEIPVERLCRFSMSHIVTHGPCARTWPAWNPRWGLPRCLIRSSCRLTFDSNFAIFQDLSLRELSSTISVSLEWKVSWAKILAKHRKPHQIPRLTWSLPKLFDEVARNDLRKENQRGRHRLHPLGYSATCGFRALHLRFLRPQQLRQEDLALWCRRRKLQKFQATW